MKATEAHRAGVHPGDPSGSGQTGAPQEAAGTFVTVVAEAAPASAFGAEDATGAITGNTGSNTGSNTGDDTDSNMTAGARVSGRGVFDRTDSPCVAVCSTLYDDVCRGCGRTAMEVANWVFLEDHEKHEIWQRITAQGYPRRKG